MIQIFSGHRNKSKRNLVYLQNVVHNQKITYISLSEKKTKFQVICVLQLLKLLLSHLIKCLDIIRISIQTDTIFEMMYINFKTVFIQPHNICLICEKNIYIIVLALNVSKEIIISLSINKKKRFKSNLMFILNSNLQKNTKQQ